MRLRYSLSVFYHSSDFFTTSLFYLYLHSDFSANIKNQNKFDYLYKNYYSSSPASLWQLSLAKLTANHSDYKFALDYHRIIT